MIFPHTQTYNKYYSHNNNKLQKQKRIPQTKCEKNETQQRKEGK